MLIKNICLFAIPYVCRANSGGICYVCKSFEEMPRILIHSFSGFEHAGLTDYFIPIFTSPHFFLPKVVRLAIFLLQKANLKVNSVSVFAVVYSSE